MRKQTENHRDIFVYSSLQSSSTILISKSEYSASQSCYEVTIINIICTEKNKNVMKSLFVYSTYMYMSVHPNLDAIQFFFK